MSSPFSLVPYALAASGRSIHGLPMNTLVAAGFTLLQRSAALVRALTSSRPAILLPSGAATLTALAACDGHVALVVDPETQHSTLARQLADADVGVVFTLSALTERLTAEMLASLVIVLLDDVPAHATVRANASARTVDLGSHVALRVEGLTNVPLSEQPMVSWFVDGTEITVSHAQTFAGAGPLSWLAAA